MCFVCLGQCLAVRRRQPWKPAKLLIGIAHLVWQFSGLFCLGSEYLLLIMYYLLQEKRADGMKEGSGTPQEAERTVRTVSQIMMGSEHQQVQVLVHCIVPIMFVVLNWRVDDGWVVLVGWNGGEPTMLKATCASPFKAWKPTC
jgi:hypothetical protein